MKGPPFSLVGSNCLTNCRAFVLDSQPRRGGEAFHRISLSDRELLAFRSGPEVLGNRSLGYKHGNDPCNEKGRPKRDL